MQLAKVFASLTDGDKLEKIKSGDDDTPAYQSMIETFRNFKKQADLTYIYTLDYIDGEVCYMVDEDPGEDHKPVGTLCDDYCDSVASVYKGELAATDGLEESTIYGNMITAYAPIYNSNNEVISVMSIDYEAGSLRPVPAKSNATLFYIHNYNTLLIQHHFLLNYSPYD